MLNEISRPFLGGNVVAYVLGLRGAK